MSRALWISRSIAAVAATLILTACPSLGPRGSPPPTLDRAEQLTQQGDHAAAARVFEALAEQNAGPDRSSLLIKAAQAFLKAKQPDEAARALGLFDAPLTAEQTFERQLLNVDISLQRGQAQQAWQQITSIAEPKSVPAAPRYLDMRRRTAFALGRPVEAVRAHIAKERYLKTPQELRAARLELLAELRTANEQGLKIEPRTVPDPVTRGWLELAALSASAARGDASAVTETNAWERRYPNHPATEVVRTELLGQQPAAPTTPIGPVSHVALLLPLSGRQASAAITVRDGFMTALFLSPSGQRPRVRVYDTATMSASDAITRAAQEGAQFVVGPLTREEVSAAADITGQRPPILALNYLPAERPKPNAFYQFALSPEDEARQTARRVLADGQRRGIAIVPNGDWGTRVLTAFKEELEAGGGTLIDTATFDTAQTDYGSAITQVLRLTDSRARHRRLESILGTKLQFEPRRRGDVGFIFTASTASVARLLRPQLKFHFAGDIPTYATSDAFEPDPTANQDMDGLIFPEMPWMLGGSLAEAVRTSTRDAWPTGGPRRNRLFAFGFDAYRLLTALRDQQGNPNISVEGLTGRLSLDADRHVRRELEWAQIYRGQPRMLSVPPPSIQ